MVRRGCVRRADGKSFGVKIRKCRQGFSLLQLGERVSGALDGKPVWMASPWWLLRMANPCWMASPRTSRGT